MVQLTAEHSRQAGIVVGSLEMWKTRLDEASCGLWQAGRAMGGIPAATNAIPRQLDVWQWPLEVCHRWVEVFHRGRDMSNPGHPHLCLHWIAFGRD